MKNGQPFFKDYVFSNCREITEEELYLINGGAQIENTNEAVAGAQPGDTLIRDDGTEVTITQGDIDWANDHLGTGGDNPSQTTPAASEPAPESQPSTPTNSSSTTGSTSQANTTNSSSSPTQSSTISKSSNLTDRGYPSSTEGYSNTRSNRDSSSTKTETKVPVFVDPFTPQSNGNYEIDNENKTVIADINNAQSVMDASGSYAVLGGRGYTFQLREGNKVVHTFSDEKAVNNYVKTLDTSKGNLSVSEISGNISTVSGVANSILQKTIEFSDDASKITKLSQYSKIFSNLSFGTGFISTIMDINKSINEPSFNNSSKVISDFAGFIPFYGPFASIVSSYGAEQIQKTAEIGIGMESNLLQKEYQLNNYINTTNSSSLPLRNMNLNTMFKSALNQAFASYFEVN